MSILILENTSLDALNNIERKKHTQRIKIIKHLYVNGAKTNSELCADFNISSPTSMSLLGELIAEGLVEKQGRGKSEGGRKPDLYGLRDNSLYVLSIAMGRFKTKMAIFDNNHNNITGIQTFPIRISEDLTAVDKLQENAAALIADSGIDTGKLMGIGISMPGLVDSSEGNNHTYMRTNSPSESLQDLLRRKLGKPVFIQNDVKSIALAEHRFGLAQGKKDVLVLSLDWGVGMGTIMNGKLCTGITGFAGEIGHIPFENDGILCYCGKRGCLETVASGIALANLAKEGIRSGQHSLLNELADFELDSIEPQLVVDAANRGDQYAINILAKVGMNLGKAIATLIQLFNPELILLGGRVAEAKQYITTPIQQAIYTYSMAQLREKTEIALSTLGKDAGILGSVAVVMENIFEDRLESES